MTIATHVIANQDALARRLIQSGEGTNLSTPTNVGDHTVTLGFGFTFIRRGTNNAWNVLDSLTADLATIGITLTTAQGLQLSAIARALTAGNTGQADQLITQFRAPTNWTTPPITDSQAETLFSTELVRAKDAIKSGFRTYLGNANGDALYAAVQNTREMAGLLSLAYNAQTLIGPGLTNALWQGNRAEAWYQIRYQSNELGWKHINGQMNSDIAQGIDKGLAKRRFAEAEYIGPYTDPANPTPNEVQNIFAMLQAHRGDIIKYELHYGASPDGRTAVFQNTIATANSDLGSAMTYGGVALPASLVLSLAPAKEALLKDLRETQYTNLARWFANDAFISTNIYLAADPSKAATLDSLNYQTGNFINGVADLMIGGSQGDTLSGNKGDDVLIGGAGNDTLEGGEGNDILIGGTGNDTYIYNSGDGNDTILDADGVGRILYRFGGATIQLSSGLRLATDPVNVYRSFMVGAAGAVDYDGKFTYTVAGADLLINIAGEAGSITIKNFNPGSLGLALNERVQPTNAIVGTEFDDRRVQGSPDASLIGSAIDDEIFGLGGDDNLYGLDGNDVLHGNLGNDLLYGGAGNDTLEGGAGDDVLVGEAGNDILSGGAGDDDLSGDLFGLGSASGNDYLDGGSGNDRLVGGGGNDILFGGDGNDFLDGDANSTAAQYHGNDYLDGGAGDDVLIGSGGDDILLGGDGNDVLYGDAAVGVAGNDALEGGAGNDMLYGNAGDDRVSSGGGDDTVNATRGGDDFIETGSGRDYADGGAGDDVTTASACA